ncbi:MAG: type II secretion system protein [Patescibacteria group bacterium]
MKKSFTLIETIVVVAVIGLTLPVLFAIIFILMRQQTKINRLSQVKREGDYVINLMENTIKNDAITIHSGKPADDANITCSLANSSFSGPPLYFLDKTRRWFGYEDGVNTIASASSAVSSINLTSSKAKISSFSLSCSRENLFSPASISLSFKIEYCNDVACNQTRPEETASLFYQTRIKLRNY